MLDAIRHGSALVLTLNIPHKRNVISRAMCAAILARLDEAGTDPDIRAIVITGAGGNFCAGGDFDDMKARGLAGWREHFDHVIRLARRMISYPKPIIAAVEGWTVGAGLSLACCCDLIVADEKARFAYGFDRVGVLPDMGLIYTLPVRVGVVRARQIMIWGEMFDAAGAKADGLVDRIAPAGSVLETALAAAEDVARAAPLPIGYLKSFTTDGLERALAFEKDCASMLFTSEDHAEGVAAFKERRQPQFTGR
ncbi:enoyl-CoA hydratase/isomerase family protein [Arvimicrobium flavum]|uniref:enoyl-CoA hydratase/isomerase family protein n=1 Tax=Arvimicrobium flavum TaxID=3393320 RepID=UPI00237A747C|nr:enoyl-CoA hydratase/isomerase family protein [Mesorhizobium shangrilense]